MKKHQFLIICYALLFLTFDAYAVIYFHDGQLHTIDYAVSETISLDWDSPGRNTRLHVVDGAEIIDTYTGVAVIAYEDSILTISGGYMSSRVECVGRSTAYFYDGIIYRSLYASAESNIYMSGGIVGHGLAAYGNGTIYLSGGGVGSSVHASGNGEIFITGGNLDVTFRASQNSIITIYGTDFNHGYGEITESSGRLTGKLKNGEWIDNYFFLNDNAKIVLAVPEPATVIVPVDIKPQSCPNPLNVKSKGILPLAILGSEIFNVNEIDVASLEILGVRPIRSSVEDVAAPVVEEALPEDCLCTTDGPDGFMDLTLKFDTQDIVEVIGEVEDSDYIILPLTGFLTDGTPIEGTDCVIILKPCRVGRAHADKNPHHPQSTHRLL